MNSLSALSTSDHAASAENAALSASDGDLFREFHRIRAELDQISHTLASRMSAGPPPERANAEIPVVRAMRRARDLRCEYFPRSMFSDPAWDVLLALYQAELAQRRMSIAGACAAAKVPSTTGLRWIQTLEASRLIQRKPDPLDRRRIFVSLTRFGSDKMCQYVQATSVN
jgi:DNA-binding MarR family transcriptional regulator